MADKKVEKGERLNKYIASTGFCSRRAADKLIEAGKVKVNNETVIDFSFCVTDKDTVKISGKALKKPEKYTYIRYYKTAGYITTAKDEKNRKTIYDALPEEVHHLKPVGRLDKDSTGLLIMTDDGDLINNMTHPKINIPKVYRVVLEGKLKNQDLESWTKGIEIEKGKIAYADYEIVDYENKNTVLIVTLYQGMNRQIRKMADFVKHPVISLKRIKHGTIDLEGLKKGMFKYLSQKQIQELKSYIKKKLKSV